MKNQFKDRLPIIKRILNLKTRKALASEFNVTLNTLRMWERGSNPGLDKLEFFLHRNTQFNSLWIITGFE